MAPSHFSSVSVQFSPVQFSYAVKPGGPEWGRRRLWAAQGVFRAVQSGAKDLALSAASCIPGFAPLSGSDRPPRNSGEVGMTLPWHRDNFAQFPAGGDTECTCRCFDKYTV